MNATIILPGAQVEPADIVIGVNHFAAGCTHAIALDLHAYSSIEPLPGVKRIISKTTIHQSQQQTGQIPPHDGVVEDLFKAYPRTVPWSAHTLTAAMVLAASLGAKQITVCGLDTDGPNDIEGAPLPELSEGEERVRHDLIIFEQTANYMMKRGTGISYSQPSPAELAVADHTDEKSADPLQLPPTITMPEAGEDEPKPAA